MVSAPDASPWPTLPQTRAPGHPVCREGICRDEGTSDFGSRWSQRPRPGRRGIGISNPTAQGAPKIPSDGLGNSHLITWKSNVQCYLSRKNWSAARLFISWHKTMQSHCLQLKISKMFHRESCPSSFSRPPLAQLQHGRIIKTTTSKNTIQLWYNVNPGSINPYAVQLGGTVQVSDYHYLGSTP